LRCKQGFTLVEFVVGLTVLSLGALILATFIRASLNLQLSAKDERDTNAQANQSLNGVLQANISDNLTFTTTNGDAILPNGYKIYGKVAQADTLIRSQFLFSVQPYWVGNSFFHLFNQPLDASQTSAYADPLQLPNLQLPSDLTAPENGPFLIFSENNLTKNQTLSQEIVVFTNSFSTSSNTLKFRPSSRQSCLLYVDPESITINDISLSHGWYLIPFENTLETLLSNPADYRLDYMLYSTDINSLTSEQKESLSLELDKAYARIILAGLTFSS
jgi:prepilin-type N-terminal cleavage/methylation domain-containing protein